jgi:DNA-binding NarL/FixJ family response regulator
MIGVGIYSLILMLIYDRRKGNEAMTSVEVSRLTERRSVQERRSGHDRRIVHAQELSLTPRQLEIVEDVVAGFSNKEIAQKLSLSEDTVKHHMTNIFDKIGVSKRLELALFATHHRLIAK